MDQNITDETIMSRLQTLPNEIANADRRVIELTLAVERTKRELNQKEVAIITGEITIDLSDDPAIRDAQIWIHTEVERNRVQTVQQELSLYKAGRDHLEREFEAMQALSRLRGVAL